jgi:hypothetical protein
METEAVQLSLAVVPDKKYKTLEKIVEICKVVKITMRERKNFSPA